MKKRSNNIVFLAASPFDRILKIGKQTRTWIADFALRYKKKKKLERAANRVELRFQKALDNVGCVRVPSKAEEREMDQLVSDSRKLAVSPEGKILKFHKILSRFHTLYLTDCKKSNRLQDVADRFKVSTFYM